MVILEWAKDPKGNLDKFWPGWDATLLDNGRSDVKDIGKLP